MFIIIIMLLQCLYPVFQQQMYKRQIKLALQNDEQLMENFDAFQWKLPPRPQNHTVDLWAEETF